VALKSLVHNITSTKLEIAKNNFTTKYQEKKKHNW